MANNDFLHKIVEHKKRQNIEKKAFYDSLKAKIGDEPLTRYAIFEKMISKPGALRLIAEIKKASPSQGLIRNDFDVLAIAKIYQDSGADAISVLTEEKFFLGSPMYLKKVAETVKVPVLKKDFILDEGQIYEARFHGASAVLLIVAILEDETLKRFIRIAHQLDLDCLVEVHDEAECDRALQCGARIIGVNNRDLRTFEVDLATAEKLIPQIPKDKVIIAESGMTTRDDILRMQNAGAHAVLIGETFMRQGDIAGKIKEMMHG